MAEKVIKINKLGKYIFLIDLVTCNVKPRGLNKPAAIGIPIKLYILANKKLSLILRTVLFDKSKQLTTSSRSFC